MTDAERLAKLERIADRVAGMGEAYRDSDGSHYSAHNHLVDYQLWEDARALVPSESQAGDRVAKVASE